MPAAMADGESGHAPQNNARLRLDEALLARGLSPSRARARDAIARGCVTVDGAPARKAGQRVAPDATIVVDDETAGFVSRAALKLRAALEHFGIDVTDRNALDVGASTGGFTQVLLQRGAAHVIALDVGHDQLHADIRQDPRVTAIEGCNARDLAPGDLAYRPDCITIDVSFISQTRILPAITGVATPNAVLITLVKPQFEVGPKRIGKDGIVVDGASRDTAVRGVADTLAALGWTVSEPLQSPILGGKGNREFLLAAWKNG